MVACHKQLDNNRKEVRADAEVMERKGDAVRTLAIKGRGQCPISLKKVLKEKYGFYGGNTSLFIFE